MEEARAPHKRRGLGMKSISGAEERPWAESGAAPDAVQGSDAVSRNVEGRLKKC